MDFGKLISLIKGGLFEPDATWASYAAKRAPWLDTAIAFSLPVIVLSALLTLIFGYLFSSFSLFGSAGFAGFIWALIAGTISVAMWAAIAAFFARMFDSGGTAPAVSGVDEADASLAADPTSSGAPTFDQAVAAISFAFLPGYVGSVLGTLPWIGTLLSLAGLVLGVVFMYRCFPVFLGVAEEDRTKHFVVTLIAGIVAAVILFSVLGAIGLGGTGAAVLSSGGVADRIEREMREEIERADRERYDSDDTGSSAADTSTAAADNSGDLFGIGRQAEYIEDADSDSYTPPDDGRLTKQQVALAVRFLTTTKDMRDEKSSRLKEISEKADNNDNPSLGDLFGGLKDVMDMGTAEMQVVKSGGGNWAEHQWVKKTLGEAKIHKDLNDTIRHNWALYSDHAEVLDELL